MLNEFIDFFSLSSPIIQNVVIGSVLLSISSSLVGCFTYLRKRALIGDAISHAILPGVCLAYIIRGEKDPLFMLIGAFVTGWLSLIAVDFIKNNTRIKEDTAIGLVLSVFFGVGTMLLTIIQHQPQYYDQAGLNHFIFGNVISISSLDVKIFGAVAVSMVLLIILFYKEFVLLAFDEIFMQSIGFPVKWMRLLMSTLTVLAVVIGIQSVGVVLMAAMLITPAATARFWTYNLKRMLLIASATGAVASVLGAFISYLTPSPTGPWIVMILSLFAVTSFFFAPKKGIISRSIRHKRFKDQITDENILKAFYQIREQAESITAVTKEQLLDKRKMNLSDIEKGLIRLVSNGFLEMKNGAYTFTDQGLRKGQRVLKLHRLWEVYMTTYMKIAPDHVHDDADSIEHIITPELEEKLEQMLNYPEHDPHFSTIPYKYDQKKDHE